MTDVKKSLKMNDSNNSYTGGDASCVMVRPPIERLMSKTGHPDIRKGSVEGHASQCEVTNTKKQE